MPSNVSILDKQRLYTQLRHQLGAPIVGVELEDDMLDSLLDIAIQDYAMYVNDWLIENQWSSLYGINVDEADLARAYTTRSLDWESSFTYAYSKIVGLQTMGPWILKKDYVELVANQQIYQIPVNLLMRSNVLHYAGGECNLRWAHRIHKSLLIQNF